MEELKKHPLHQHRKPSRLEAEALDETRKRAKDRRAKRLVSNTSAGVAMRKEMVSLVKKELEAALKPYDEQGKGNKPRWYKPLREVRTDLTANLSVNCFLDAAGKGWSLTKAREQTAKTFIGLLYEQLVYGTGKRQKMFERFKERMMKQLGDTYRRVDMFHARCEELGFDIQHYQDPKVLQSIGGELMNHVMRAGFLTYKKERKFGDINKTRYLLLSDELQKQLDLKNLKLDLMSPYYSLVEQPPHEWRKHPDGWSRSGPYDAPRLNQQLHVVRHMGEAQRMEIEKLIDTGRLEKPLKALHTIQETPLQMNEYVIEAIQWVKDNDLGTQLNGWPNIKEIDKLTFKGQQYDVEKKMPDDEYAALSDDEQTQFKRLRRGFIAANLAAKGNGTNLFRFVNEPKDADEPYGEANKLLNEEQVYPPHNWDNRSRIYPINTMNHHDADCYRALFMFKKSWLVTEDNVGWLLNQLVNTYGNGIDKLNIDKHPDWLEENNEAIRACGEDFIKTFDIWKHADEPFQFLAACHEYAKFSTAEEKGEPYYSSLPIAVDASQSGVQHFALSLLDPRDAKRVNLGAGEDRRDIYMDCLVVAKRLMEEDLAVKQLHMANDPVTDADRANLKAHEEAVKDENLTTKQRRALRRKWNRSASRRRLKTAKEVEVIGQVKAWSDPDKCILPYGRSVIKRNVMTFCYSSKQFGFSQQLRTDWMDKLSEQVRLSRLNQHPFGDDEGFAACTYLGGVHERAIREVVKSAEKGMNFIQKLVRILATYKLDNFEMPEKDDDKKTHNKDGIHLRFMTPIGFPMYQNYVREINKRTSIPFFDQPMQGMRPDDTSVRDYDYTQLWVEKSINASAPNIIHAMDATHLMMTVNALKEDGVTDIMVVHDSFACGIGDMDKLSFALRDQLVKLYRNYNLYEDLLKQAKALHPDPDSVNWPELPERGDDEGNLFDIDEVYESLGSFL